jgi:hypothetical protein
MHSLAKKIVRIKPNTKIVRVENTATSPMGHCWANAVEHSNATGSKIVNGWLVMPGDNCLRDDAIGTFAKHYWNKLNGRYIDTTYFHLFNDATYVLYKEDCIGNWLADDSFQYILEETA